MKKLWMFCAVSGFLFACGENTVGDRTYDMNTPTDSANYPIYGMTGDTTQTSNNNAYNPDSMPENTTLRDTSAVRQFGTQGQAGQQSGQSGQKGQAGQEQSGQSNQSGQSTKPGKTRTTTGQPGQGGQ